LALLRALLPALLLLLPALAARAQELEPRAYSNLPVGLHFAIVVYGYSEGGLSTDPSLPIEDAHLQIHTTALAYSQSLNLYGSSGRFDLILPFSDLSGTALVAGEPASRNISGANDPRLRLAVNFHGAPAGDLKAYAQYMAQPPRTVLGASLQVIPPLGQYDPARLINLGTNRWAFKPDIGFSRRIKSFTWDMTFGAAFVTENDNFYGGKTVKQDPLYSTQLNVSYDFGKGFWVALGATYYFGGQTAVNGVDKDNQLGNSRVGLTVAYSLNRHYSLKFNVSTGISTRTGTNFNTSGVGLQYRWGGGL
jgi:hypothetical protein